MNRNAAVSYTHLRAHETVLDLVCRLLLEKKKKRHTNTKKKNYKRQYIPRKQQQVRYYNTALQHTEQRLGHYITNIV